ncbi:MAG: hypothetical protein ACHQ6V_04050 [Myxococcota bacterium]
MSTAPQPAAASEAAPRVVSSADDVRGASTGCASISPANSASARSVRSWLSGT